MSLRLQDVVIASNCQLVTSSWQVVSFVLLNWKFPMLINNTITETSLQLSGEAYFFPW